MLAGGGAIAAPQASPEKTASQDGKIGEVRMDNYTFLRMEPSLKAGVRTVILAGPSLVVTSPRYRMAAPRITLTFKGSTVTTGLATGGVQVTVKDAASNQTTTVTCDTATYSVTAAFKRGRIDLKGTVRTKTYSPGFAQPLVSKSESGFIEFTSNGPVVQLNDGSATVTPNEAVAAPAKK